MPKTATLDKAVTLNGKTYQVKTTINGDVAPSFEKSVGPAKVGQLTTRTNNTDGTLTMNAGHGFITGDRLDLYWLDPTTGVRMHRRGVAAGTVVTNTVPISGGAGDNLPVNLTAITAMVPQPENLTFTGNDVVVITAYSLQGGQIVFTDAGNVEKHNIFLKGAVFNDTAYSWTSADGSTNPFSGDTPTKMFFSTWDPVNAVTLRGELLYT